MPSALGNRNKPPAAATSDRLTSGSPKTVSVEAIMRSQDSEISHPPATAVPVIAAISGFVLSRRVIPPKPPFLVARAAPLPAAISLRSAPAQNTVPSALRIPTQSSGSFSNSSRQLSIVCAISPLIALRASGRFRVMIARCPCFSISTAITSSFYLNKYSLLFAFPPGVEVRHYRCL